MRGEKERGRRKERRDGEMIKKIIYLFVVESSVNDPKHREKESGARPRQPPCSAVLEKPHGVFLVHRVQLRPCVSERS